MDARPVPGSQTCKYAHLLFETPHTLAEWVGTGPAHQASASAVMTKAFAATAGAQLCHSPVFRRISRRLDEGDRRLRPPDQARLVLPIGRLDAACRQVCGRIVRRFSRASRSNGSVGMQRPERFAP